MAAKPASPSVYSYSLIYSHCAKLDFAQESKINCMRLHAPGEYYHVFNRGIRKQPIFYIQKDYIRFLFLILTFQGGFVIKNISREIEQSVQNRILHIDEELKKDVLKNRMVELVSFCLVPNHFHILVRELEENGISKYIQRVLIAYAKYFNLRHDKSGYLFQGNYKDVHIEDDRQLMHTSAYIHKHPCEIGWKGKEHLYPWSSYQDCVGENRFEQLLVTDILAKRFEDKSGMTYREFVNTSPAKELNRIAEIIIT